jgi:hypothetical protein
VEASQVDKIGTAGIIKKIRDRVGTKKPVYLSLDIDTLDPACAFQTHIATTVKHADIFCSRTGDRNARDRGLEHT